jgi:hypothetical protein
MSEMQMTWEEQEMFRLLKNAPGTKYQEADDTEKHIIRDWLRSLLFTQVVTVEFVKADGSLRAMQCTLCPELIPASEAKFSIDGLPRSGKKETSVDVQAVFDVEAQQWRSFRYDRLKRILAEIRLDK